jgi:hypothetical protein
MLLRLNAQHIAANAELQRKQGAPQSLVARLVMLRGVTPCACADEARAAEQHNAADREALTAAFNTQLAVEMAQAAASAASAQDALRAEVLAAGRAELAAAVESSLREQHAQLVAEVMRVLVCARYLHHQLRSFACSFQRRSNYSAASVRLRLPQLLPRCLPLRWSLHWPPRSQPLEKKLINKVMRTGCESANRRRLAW